MKSIITAPNLATLTLTLLALLACALPAQLQLPQLEKKVIPELPELKLPTEKDKKGLLQWKKFPTHNCLNCKTRKTEECLHCRVHEDPKICPECKVTRKAPCHVCAGEGKMANPLEEAICPGCSGHGFFICYLCSNTGEITYGSGGGPQKCASCKGVAGLACLVCKGKRLVPSAFNGKLGNASLKKLHKLKDGLPALMQKIDSFQIKGEPRKDRKAFAAILKEGNFAFPHFKKLNAHVELISKGLDQRHQGIGKKQNYAFERIRRYLLIYLVNQSRALDACIERAEANKKGAKG